jgi:hypothetical protein
VTPSRAGCLVGRQCVSGVFECTYSECGLACAHLPPPQSLPSGRAYGCCLCRPVRYTDTYDTSERSLRLKSRSRTSRPPATSTNFGATYRSMQKARHQADQRRGATLGDRPRRPPGRLPVDHPLQHPSATLRLRPPQPRHLREHPCGRYAPTGRITIKSRVHLSGAKTLARVRSFAPF